MNANEKIKERKEGELNDSFNDFNIFIIPISK